LLLDVDGRILTGELTELLLGCLQALPHLLQSPFEKDPFPARAGGAQLALQAVERLGVSLSHPRRPARILVRNCDGDDQALAVRRGDHQLDQLVAPIALYPDQLIALILAASTYPAQVADADGWRQAQSYASPDQIAAGANVQNWDPSVKALAAFPQVLSEMDANLAWTSALGNAYYNQPNDVQQNVERLSKAVHIKAFKYLRGPLEEMRPEIEAGLDEAVAEAAAEGEA